MKQIYDTFVNTIEFDRFEYMYNEAISKLHCFLFITIVPKKNTRDFVVDLFTTSFRVLGDYNIAFKYNKRVITANSQYPLPFYWDKYSLDHKMLNEDLRNVGLVERFD